MYTSFSDQIAAGARPLLISQLTLWNTINQRALDGVVALAALNMNTARQSVTDASAVVRSAGSDNTSEAPPWAKAYFIPQDLGNFASYGREAANICMAMQSDIAKFMQEGLTEVARDMPSMFKNENTDSPAPRTPARRKA
jgi:Phasin protein